MDRALFGRAGEVIVLLLPVRMLLGGVVALVTAILKLTCKEETAHQITYSIDLFALVVSVILCHRMHNELFEHDSLNHARF